MINLINVPAMVLILKIGQLNQYNDDWTATGPVTVDNDKVNKFVMARLAHC